MNAWAWLTAYVVGFGLLQVLLYQYVQTTDPTPESTPERTAGAVNGSGSRAGDDPTRHEESVVRCRHCGAANESHLMLRYCGTCTESLR
ncbi:DUF7577 domain-containing protein [Haloarcula nitratireducens]|uniref:DUF7577 domain-containing protein n=1 Tax=Haloarcula nitratireducens TaxID=2487749 RepID=A0AAW4PCM9_9EURY|nr:hypothetical protein [Halomicroarcula nitratireducens]MBX0295466.1 hypothetical protein [Halomicroarcula nitratireducens]